MYIRTILQKTNCENSKENFLLQFSSSHWFPTIIFAWLFSFKYFRVTPCTHTPFVFGGEGKEMTGVRERESALKQREVSAVCVRIRENHTAAAVLHVLYGLFSLPYDDFRSGESETQVCVCGEICPEREREREEPFRNHFGIENKNVIDSTQ